jgi:Spy/CpxP family protein refolding chaperone
MRSPLSLAAISAVQKELGLTEDQIAKLKTLGDEARAEMQQGVGGFEGLRDLPAEERRAKMTEFMAKQAEAARKVAEKYKPKVAEVLDAKQVERLDQIALQAAGVQALSDPAVAKTLKLSKDQQDKLASINKDFAEKQRESFAGGAGGGGDIQDRFAKMREMSAARDKDLEAVLTSDQKDQFAAMKGKAFDVAQLRGPGGPGGAGGRPGGGRARPDGEAASPRRPQE